jgi:hypothetical protein
LTAFEVQARRPGVAVRPWCWITGIAVLFAAGGGTVLAATFPDLYTVTVVVPANTPNRQPEVDRIGMAQLLTRVTGRRDAAYAPQLAPLIENASAHVTSRSRIDRERDTVGFNSAAIVDALARANWPVWGAERPLTLLWIAVDLSDGPRALMGASPAAEEGSPELTEIMTRLREEIDAVASERGLPTTYPLLDLEDRAAIGFADVWGGFDALISAASERYNADGVLVGRVGVNAFGIDVRWSFLGEGGDAAVLGSDVRGGIDWLADQYAAEYSTIGGAHISRIAVLDVTNLDEYARVMSHLETLSVLQSVDVEGFEGSTLRLRAAVRGDDRVVERVLTLGGVLVPSAVVAVGEPIETLVFRVAGAPDGQ